MADLRLRLVLPVFRMGPVTIDPIKAVLGQSVCDIFGPLITAVRDTADGQQLDVRLPNQVGANVPLGVIGEAGFRNESGRLILSMPRFIAGQTERALSPYVVARQLGPNGLEELAVELPPGRPIELPLGSLATITICRIGAI